MQAFDFCGLLVSLYHALSKHIMQMFEFFLVLRWYHTVAQAGLKLSGSPAISS